MTDIFYANGRVGIGTTDPQFQLHVATPEGRMVLQDSDSPATEPNFASFIQFLGADGKSAGYIGDGSQTRAVEVVGGTDYQLSFATDGVQRMVLDTNGHLGIGTDTPAAILHVSAMSSDKVVIGNAVPDTNLSSPKLAFHGGGDNPVVGPSIQKIHTGPWGQGRLSFFQHNTGDYTSDYEAVVITPNGSVGVGTTEPAATLDVNGTARLARYSSPPFPCDAAHDGTIALTSQRKLCICDGSNWLLAAKDAPTQCWP